MSSDGSLGHSITASRIAGTDSPSALTRWGRLLISVLSRHSQKGPFGPREQRSPVIAVRCPAVQKEDGIPSAKSARYWKGRERCSSQLTKPAEEEQHHGKGCGGTRCGADRQGPPAVKSKPKLRRVDGVRRVGKAQQGIGLSGSETDKGDRRPIRRPISQFDYRPCKC